MTRTHLSDDRLIEICLADSFSPVDEPHLRTCERCESRRTELAATLADVSTRVMEEADAAFPADRLARQHARILNHIDHLGRPARVIAFPAGHASESARPALRRTRRWIAATGAVAAAFLVGIYTEHFAHQFPLSRPDARIASRAADTVASRTVIASVSDDELLGQIELAGGSTAPAVLAPLDALTPRAWDVQ
jgi:hypothetical protein